MKTLESDLGRCKYIICSKNNNIFHNNNIFSGQRRHVGDKVWETIQQHDTNITKYAFVCSKVLLR